MPTTKKKPDFIVAPMPSLADDLIDRLVAFKPLREEQLDTRLGPADAVIARIIEICEDGEFVDHGENPVFWNLVCRQLRAAKDEATWIVGRLTRPGQAYRLEAPSEAEQGLFAKVLSKVTD